MSNDAVKLDRLAPAAVSDRPMITISIAPAGSGQLSVTLHLPLVPENDEHEPFIDRGLKTLVVTYAVPDPNLTQTRRDLWNAVRRAYDDPELGPALKARPERPLAIGPLREYFTPVAQIGHSVRRHLFEPKKDTVMRTGCPPADADAIRKIVRDYFRLVSLPISVNSDSPLFPWNFLYDDPDFLPTKPSTLNLASFWGFRHEIQQEIAEAAAALYLPERPRIVAAVCPALDPDTPSEPGHPLRAGDVEFISDIGALGKRLQDFPGDCFYFYGHADQDDPPREYSSVLLLQDASLNVTALRTPEDPRFERNPVLLFLNGCETGHLVTWDSNTVAGCLVHAGMGQTSCVLTTAEVPGEFAKMFARHFWGLFLKEREPLGSALRGARLMMLNAYNHPLGLLYDVLGRTEMRAGAPRH